MSKFLQFISTYPPYNLSDLSKVTLIRDELQKIVGHQSKLHITVADIGLDDCLGEVLDILNSYLDNEPGDEDIDMFPVTAHEMWQNAHDQHIAMHS
jgi:hypothetical protein